MADLQVTFEVAVPMSDGTILRGDIYRPVTEEPVPLIVQRTPYGRANAAAGAPLDGMRLVRHGYALLVQDARGCYASEGHFRPFLDEAGDGADTIAWATAQDWCNKRVAMVGDSYLGLSQWLTASRNPPGLAAIVPSISASDVERHWLRRGGEWQLGFILYLVASYFAVAEGNASAEFDELRSLTADYDDVYGDPAAVEALLRRVAPYYDSWRVAGVGDAESFVDLPGRCHVPAMVVAGWHDLFLDGSVSDFLGTTHPGSRLLIGPWTHRGKDAAQGDVDFGPTASAGAIDLTGRVIDFLDRYTRATRPPDATLESSRITYFRQGANVWQTTDRWPPAADTLQLYLEPGARSDGGVLTVQPPPDHAGTGLVISFDPAAPTPTHGGATLLAPGRQSRWAGPVELTEVDLGAAVVLHGEPLSAELTVEGSPTLLIASHIRRGKGVPLIEATLLDVFPDGRQRTVCDGVRRVEPVSDAALNVKLDPTAYTFAAGHRVGLRLASSSYPRYDVRGTVGPGALWIGCSGDRPTVLRLPTR